MINRSAPASLLAGLVALIAGMSLLSGCGTSNHRVSVSATSSKKATKRGSVTFNIKWPVRPVAVKGKVIPELANSVVVTLTRETPTTNVVAVPPQTLVRPTGGSLASSCTFTNLELGGYAVSVVAYPGSDGSGNAQASGPQAGSLGSAESLVTVNAGTNAPLNVTMFATIASLSMTTTPALSNGGVPPLRVGESLPITVSAYDANQNLIVITSTTLSSISFTSSTPGVATVTPTSSTVPTAATATLSAVAIGSTTITAQYVEPGVTAGTQGTGASASFIATVTPVGLASSAWAKFHGDAQNTGAAPRTSGTSVTGSSYKPWSVGNEIEYSSPAISADGTTIYVGADDNNLYAIYATGSNAGKIKWTFTTGGFVEASPAVSADGTVYFGSQDGNLYAVKDKSSGQTAYTLLWTFSAGSPINGSPTIDNNGILYFGSDATYDNNGNVTQPGSVYFLDSLSGAQIENASGAPLVYSGDSVGYNSTPALDTAQDRLYIGAESGYLYEISTADASVKGAYLLPDSIQHSSPVIGTVSGLPQYVFQATTGGHVYAFNAALVNTGPLWTYSATGQILATPAFSATNGVLYVATYDNISGQYDSRVSVVDASDGAEIERTSPINPNSTGAGSFVFASSPAISADGTTVYVGCENGYVYGVTVTGLVTGTTPISGSYLTLTALIQASGNSAQFPILIDSSPAIGSNGYVYIGGFDGNVYAITQ